ncbi:MAG: ATP-binding protein [Bdellovibrionota bacterium]
MKMPPSQSVEISDLKVEYERFFEASLDMLCISSYDGHFKKVNPAFEKTLGFPAEELCTKSYLDFIHPDDIERTLDEVKKQLLMKQHVLSFENRYRCKDGSYKWLSWTSAPVGQYMYAVARDVTDAKLANDELKKARDALQIMNSELESFSYSVAHDLRAPVRSIAGFGATILKDPESALSAESRKDLERVLNAAKRMGVLIDSLLKLSQLARKDLVKQPVNLSIFVRDVANELQALNPERKVSFVIAEDVIVDGDPELLRMVISNLVGNAWKYSSKSDRDITIEFGQSNKDGVRVLFVRDNGAGFDMKYKAKLFGVFQRLHSNQEFEGTGVGLATTQKIILRHGGRIWASAAPDEGATFYFTL